MSNKTEMKRTYLIQRLQAPTKRDNPFSFGGGYQNGGLSSEAMALVRPIFSFDYMGSAEFEFGAVPSALNRLGECAASSELTTGIIEENGTIYYLTPESIEDEVVDIIRKLRKDERSFRLKERCMLSEYFNKDRTYPVETRGWLELDNGFMFFVDEEMWTKTCALFEVGKEADDE